MKWRRSRFGLPLSASRCAPRRPTLSGPSPAAAAARRHPGPSGARTAPSVPQPHTVSELSPVRQSPPPQRVSLSLTLSRSRSSSFSASERVLFITHPEALEPPPPRPPNDDDARCESTLCNPGADARHRTAGTNGGPHPSSFTPPPSLPCNATCTMSTHWPYPYGHSGQDSAYLPAARFIRRSLPEGSARASTD